MKSLLLKAVQIRLDTLTQTLSVLLRSANDKHPKGLANSSGVEDHKRLKALATVLGKSMREIVSDWIHENLYSENVLNAATLKAIDSIEKSKDLVAAKDAQDMFCKLGI